MVAVFAGGTLLFAACAADAAGRPSATTPEATAPATPTSSAGAPQADSADPAVAEPVTVPQVESSARAVSVSGLAIAQGLPVANAPEPLVELAEIRSGGPPPDGIPAIDEPTFLTPDAVDFLAENEPVLAVDVDGDARAYPVQILMWHEIVNDTVAGVPMAVTYCPLCNSAVAYDRRVDDRVLDFGTSGLLWNSALVMYDRQTETLWSHFTGQGIVGELTGVELDTYPVATAPWGAWRDANPDGLVLSRETGFDRQYGRNPYPGYDDVNNQPFLFEGEVDGRYTAMTRLVGIEVDGEAVGVTLAHLREERVVTATAGGTDLVVLWTPGVASALDSGDVAGGEDVGATGVFLPVADGTALTFSADSSTFIDDQTGSSWTILGEATAGPLAGTQLEAVEHVDTFWFAWAAFMPDTVVIDE